MTEPKSVGPHLEAMYKQLLHEVNLVTLKWLTVHELFGVSKERIELLNRTAGGFFGVVQVSLRDDTFLSLSRLTDPIQSAGRGNLTILRLLEQLDRIQHGSFFESFQKQIVSAVEKCDPIRIWRNKRLAHSDLNTVLKYDAEPLPGISVNQVNESLKSVQDVINVFSEYFFDTTNYFGSIIQTGGTDRLLHHLKIGLETQEREIEEKLNLRGLTSLKRK